METSEKLEINGLEGMNWGLGKKIPHHIKGHQCIDTGRTLEDVFHQVKDQEDVYYSVDGKRLINATGLLSSYTVQDGTQVICHGAFCETYAKEIILPDSVLAIGFNPFGLTRLKKFVIPKNVCHIETVNPFATCFTLEELIVDSPNYVVEQGILYTSDYRICYGAVTKEYPMDLVIHEGTEIIANSAFFKRKLNSVYIPDTVKEIGYAAFAYSGLMDLRLPHSIDKISEACFECCRLKIVVIPEYVRSICEDAFNSNEVLESISMLGNVEKIGLGTLSCCPNLNKISGPSESKIMNLKTMLKAGLNDRQNLHSHRKTYRINGRNLTTMILK